MIIPKVANRCLGAGNEKQKQDAGLKPGATKTEAESLNDLLLHFDS
jgi:hypothetical protein